MKLLSWCLILFIVGVSLFTVQSRFSDDDNKSEVSLVAANELHLRLAKVLSEYDCEAQYEGPLGYSGRALLMVNPSTKSHKWSVYASDGESGAEAQAVFLRLILEPDGTDSAGFPVELTGIKYTLQTDPPTSHNSLVSLKEKSLPIRKLMELINSGL